MCKPWGWMSHKWDGEAWNNKKDNFSILYTPSEAVPAGQCKGIESNLTLPNSVQQLHKTTAWKAIAILSSSLISKDVRSNVRASQRSQCSSTHCQCLICNNYCLSESRNNASLLNPYGIWHNRNLTNDLKTPTYFRHATAVPACDQGMGTICDTRLHPVLQGPTVGINNYHPLLPA